MGILRKLFGGETKEPDARLTGRGADFEHISRLVDQERHAEAVAALDRFLGLPADSSAAAKRLGALLKDPQQFRADVRSTGRDAEARDLVTVRMGFGGGSLPQLMALRGRFLLSAIETRIKEAMSDRAGLTSDPELLRLQRLSIDHVNLCVSLFMSDNEVLVPAARLCGVFGNYQGMQQLLAQVLQRDPNHAEAKDALADLARAAQR